MATVTQTKLIDDLDGTSEADETLEFGLDGRRYEMELTTEHAEDLRETLQPYIGAARRADGGGGGRKPPKPEPGGKGGLTKEQAAAIREWVRSNGDHIGDRGRIPQKYIDAYNRKDTSIFKKAEGDEDEPETDGLDEFAAEDVGDEAEDEPAGEPVSAGVGDPFQTF